MQKESTGILLRIFIGEHDKYQGKNTYQYLVEYLKEHKYAGVTVLRGIEGFGKTSKLHTANLMELSSDLPIIIEIIETQGKIDSLKKFFDASKIIGDALVTEQQVIVHNFK